MNFTVVVVIILVLLLFGALPVFPHSTAWGYGPSGLLGMVVIVLLILIVLGRL